jgi:tetratricopeptide (TPR) repeat protein
LASKKEKWYTLRSKALLENGDLEDAIKISNEALEVLDEFRNYSDVWFKWRIALANKELGEFDTALEYLNEILLSKTDWFILKEIAEVYFFKENLDEALKYATDAALRFGEVEKKINLYSLLEDILNGKGLNKEALKHTELIYHIRKENNWEVDERLTPKLEENGINTDEVKNPRKLEKDLKKYWETLKFANQEQLLGTISNLLPHGKAGFINSEDGNSYYFNINEFKSPKNQLNPGTNVSFFLEDSFDKKRNKKTKQAVNIHSSF